MKTTDGKLPGLFILEPVIFKDSRGYFFESYNREKVKQHLGDIHWVQDNEAGSHKNVLRGFHYQLPPFAQSKLVRVTEGSVLDIAIDIRPKSPTYGQYQSIVLSNENKLQFFIPAGFAHGYLVLSDYAVFNYKCDNYYAPKHEGGIRFDDPQLAIDLPVDPKSLIVSEKDRDLPDFGKHLPFK